jgi:pyruvate,water dikinase
VLSAEAGRRIRELAQVARQTEPVARLLREHPGDDALPLLRETPEAADFLARLAAFLAVFGHRAVREFELRSPRWEEEPSQVLGLVRNFLAAEPEAGDHAAQLARRRAELQRSIDGRLLARPLEQALGLRRRFVDYLAARVKHFARIRENSRFYWIMAAYVTRKKLLSLEARLIAAGRLRTRDDIFFLELPEIEGLSEGRLTWPDVEPLIAARRRDHVRHAKMTPPRTIGIVAPSDAAAARHTEDATVLRGETASPGHCEGVARVILDPSVDAALAPGEILVAPYTDPAWTPLFLAAGAAVVEVGSFLSHAGTVAREYGLPCVVDVAECTRRIQTGDRLAVDGDHGVVRILHRAGP